MSIKQCIEAACTTAENNAQITIENAIEVAQNTALAEASKNAAAQSALEADTAKNEAVIKANEILEYVIPSGTAKSIDQSNTDRTAMSKAAFNAIASNNRDKFGGSGIVEPGHTRTGGIYGAVNQGISAVSSLTNKFFIGGDTFATDKASKTPYPVVEINGVIHKLSSINEPSANIYSQILLPNAPTVLPYTATLTAEQIASGVIKHADASNSGLIVNGKANTDTSVWPTHNSPVLSIDTNRLKMLSTLSYGRAYQGIPTVVGKKYTLEMYVEMGTATSISLWVGTSFLNNDLLTSPSITTSGRKEFTFTATSTTSYIQLITFGVGAYAFFDNIAVFPADAISRSDLVFLESWHEDTSEKDAWHPYGLPQYLGGDTDGLTGIATAAFSGASTYSLFGNWQAANALVGKIYKPSLMTEADKTKFLANPEHNIYQDGSKLIQVKDRMRVVQGMGDVFINVDPQNTVYTYLQHANGNPFYVKPKGKLTSIASEFGGSDTLGVFGNKNAGLKTLSETENGIFTAMYSTGVSGVPAVAYEGKCFALPIALVHRRNQGGYDLTYNPHGTRAMTMTPTNIADCFTEANLTMTTGYIGTSTPRPDGLFYDQVSVEDFKPVNKGADLRNSAQVKQYKTMFDSWVAKDTAGKLTFYPVTTAVSLTTLATDGTRTLAYSATTGRVYYTNATAQYQTDAFIKLGAIL